MKRVGIYAGTFDPIHAGHIAFAREAITQHDLDKVFLMVEPRPRRKQGVKALEHRLNMVLLAIEKESKLARIVLEQTRFSVHNTLPVLNARFKGAELHFLVGDDVLNHLIDWPNVEELVGNVKFIVGRRLRTKKEIDGIIKTITKVKGVKVSYKILISESSHYNSSKIRQDLRKGKRPEGVDDRVWQYIRERNLYSASNK